MYAPEPDAPLAAARPTASRRGRRRPARAAAAIAGAVALGLAGCAGESPTTAPPQEQQATTTAPPQPLARYRGYTSRSHADPSRWVCRPDTADICDSGLDSTTVAADGTLTVERFEPAADPPVDCFYVYPTISRDQTANSDWNASPDEEGWVTLNQVGRMASTCRVFAPVYRQMTLKALSSRFGGETAAPSAEPIDAFAEVLDAFRTYMANDNGGRPFVLVSHSQGSMMLQRLITEEIDPNADVREKLLVAFLAGWTLEVTEGSDAGGQFTNLPLCRSRGQTGCVFAWSSFRGATPPPDDAFFGKARTAGRVAACNTPSTLTDGSPVELHGYYPADTSKSIISTLGASGGGGSWVDASTGTITTPFVSLPGLVQGACRQQNGFHYLAVTTSGSPADPRADDIGGELNAQWGLHLQDVNLVMGDMVAWVRDAAGRR